MSYLALRFGYEVSPLQSHIKGKGPGWWCSFETCWRFKVWGLAGGSGSLEECSWALICSWTPPTSPCFLNPPKLLPQRYAAPPQEPHRAKLTETDQNKPFLPYKGCACAGALSQQGMVWLICLLINSPHFYLANTMRCMPSSRDRKKTGAFSVLSNVWSHKEGRSKCLIKKEELSCCLCPRNPRKVQRTLCSGWRP